MTWFHAIPHTTPRPWQDAATASDAHPTAFALAGSRFVWFDRVNVWAETGCGASRLVSDLAGSLRTRLSAPRPAIAGLALDRPRLMAIVNVTPDSFSDGGDRFAVETAVAAARAMVSAGADILDIGGESTRPGAETVPEQEEIRRVTPVVTALRTSGIVTPISIDTRKAAVAAAALEAGADLVNDVSALRFDSAMAGLIAERGVPVCLMHAQGTPKTMQVEPKYQDVVTEVADFLAERIAYAESEGILHASVMVDPGLGFGKTLAHNMALLKALALFHDLGVPVLVGASRKGFIGTLGQAPDAKARMPGSLAVALHAASHGAHMLRVHDVAETRQALLLWQALVAEPGTDAAAMKREQ